jgi:DNA replication protein DnaC
LRARGSWRKMRAMKHLGLFAAILIAGAGCENQHSRLDDVPKTQPKAELPSLGPNATVEQRLARVEAELANRKEALDFLDMAFEQNKQAAEQQKKQQQMREQNEPASDATFAVDITPDLKAGQVEGPNNALVTIIEAWDFG